MACHAQGREIYPECRWCADNVGRLALWGNVGLFIVKLVCGAAGDSWAVIADAVHSASDVVLAVILMVCLRISNSPPDEEHPYGHGNIEYIASLFVGVSLTTIATLIIITSVSEILAGVAHQPNILALLALVISIIGNELMFRHSLCCGNRYGSPAMIANAWENRADVYSTVAALVGVVGAQLGLLFMDPVGAILVAVLLFYSAFQMMRNAWRGILDHSIEEPKQRKIRALALRTPGVREVVELRTRAMGPYTSVDLKILVGEEKSLEEGCAISESVKSTLSEKLERVGVITVTPVGKATDDDR
jgi:cation diffusion facilitator family transporter